VYRVVPDRSIGVDSIRAVLASIQLRAFCADHKAVIIEQADSMTPQAQNCLLRTLEDPPEGAVFLLSSDSLDAMLVTLRSRCRLVRLAPLPDKEVEERLVAKGIHEEKAILLASLARGSVGEALLMHQDEAFWALRDRMLKSLFAVQGSAAYQSASTLREERAYGEQAIDIAEIALIDALRMDAKAAEPLFHAYPEEWKNFVRRTSSSAKLRLMKHIVRCKKMLASNVSLQAVIEEMIMRFTEEYVICPW
jgi:DNA polymerase-3 subunit delta'